MERIVTLAGIFLPQKCSLGCGKINILSTNRRNAMRHLVLLFLFTGITLLYFSCSQNDPIISDLNKSDPINPILAKTHLTGTIDMDFTGTPPYFWVGTVTFGTETYGLQFKSVGSPPPPPPRAFVFVERFEIWDEGFTTLYVEGPNAGVVPCGNDKFIANGRVETANQPFEMWIDRNVHINGNIDWVIPCVLPDGGTGTIRFN